jgi:hypothetical protein
MQPTRKALFALMLAGGLVSMAANADDTTAADANAAKVKAAKTTQQVKKTAGQASAEGAHDYHASEGANDMHATVGAKAATAAMQSGEMNAGGK